LSAQLSGPAAAAARRRLPSADCGWLLQLSVGSCGTRGPGLWLSNGHASFDRHGGSECSDRGGQPRLVNDKRCDIAGGTSSDACHGCHEGGPVGPTRAWRRDRGCAAEPSHADVSDGSQREGRPRADRKGYVALPQVDLGDVRPPVKPGRCAILRRRVQYSASYGDRRARWVTNFAKRRVGGRLLIDSRRQFLPAMAEDLASGPREYVCRRRVPTRAHVALLRHSLQREARRRQARCPPMKCSAVGRLRSQKASSWHPPMIPPGT
jgi:hypothetical protein